MFRLILISLLCCWLPGLAASNTNFTHLTVKDGLLNSTVYYAMQDSKGFIWFCTETGVNRYDGRQFESFTVKDGLADNENFKCYEDKEGRIWFLSYNGRLSYYYKGKIYNGQNTPALSYKDDDVFLVDCVEDRYGAMWFNTSVSDVLKVTDTKVELIPSAVPIKQRNNYYFSSKLFISGTDVKKLTLIHDKIYELDLTTMKLSFIDSLGSILNAPKFKPALTGNKDDQYFFTENTLIKYDASGFKMLDKGMLKMNVRIMSFLQDDSDWWIGTNGEGVARVCYHRNETPEIDYFLEGQSVTNILKDSEGNVWFTTLGNGVFLLRKNASKITVLSTEPAFSIAIIKQGGSTHYYAGGAHGNVAVYDERQRLIKTIDLTHNRLNRVHDILRTSNSSIGIFTDGPLMFTYKIKTGVSTSSGAMQGYKAGSVDSSGNIWICTHERILKFTNNALQDIDYTGMPGKIRAFAAVSDSLFYVGTTNRLIKVIKGNVPKIIMNDNVLKTGISDLKITNNFLWVATHGDGIFLIKNDSIFKHIGTDNGLVSDVCQKLYDDKQKYIWLATNNGISVLNRSDGSLLYNFSSSDGLISDDVKNINSINDSIFIATSAGVNFFKLGDLISHNAAPKVYIMAFNGNGKTITDPSDTVSFIFFKGFINIHFTAITYEAPLANKYEYKFENDKDWQHAKVTEISLFSLPPGVHKLLLRAKKYNSSWSSPTVFTIIVKPLWYQTIWFYWFTACLLIVVIYSFFIWRIQYLRKLSDEQNKYKLQIVELESKSLAYQMNPHFIFNSLNTVQQFILTKDVKQSLDYLSEFSKLMRQILQNSKKPFIPLSEEIDFLTRYLELEKIRYSNKFNYAIHLDKALQKEDIKMPAMLFQPLLENAVKHGIASVDNGYIVLDLKVINGHLVGTVADNGNGFRPIADAFTNGSNKEPTALKVLEERLKLIKGTDGKNGSFKVIDKRLINEHGTIIEITIPLNMKL